MCGLDFHLRFGDLLGLDHWLGLVDLLNFEFLLRLGLRFDLGLSRLFRAGLRLCWLLDSFGLFFHDLFWFGLWWLLDNLGSDLFFGLFDWGRRFFWLDLRLFGLDLELGLLGLLFNRGLLVLGIYRRFFLNFPSF